MIKYNRLYFVNPVHGQADRKWRIMRPDAIVEFWTNVSQVWRPSELTTRQFSTLVERGDIVLESDEQMWNRLNSQFWQFIRDCNICDIKPLVTFDGEAKFQMHTNYVLVADISQGQLTFEEKYDKNKADKTPDIVGQTFHGPPTA